MSRSSQRRVGTESNLLGISESSRHLRWSSVLTVIERDTGGARVAGAAARPIPTTTLLPHGNGRDSGSEDRRRRNDLFHGCQVALVM